MLYYDLSSENRITAVSGGWDAAAVANTGFNCVAKKVVGRNILDFVSGFQTQTYVNALLFAARTSGKSVSNTYRCDSDVAPRLIYMTVSPRDNGQLRVMHRDIPIAVAPEVPLFEGQILRGQCGQCYALHLNKDWVAAGVGHDMFMAPVSTGLCPKCRALAANAISANMNYAAARVSRPKSGAVQNTCP